MAIEYITEGATGFGASRLVGSTASAIAFTRTEGRGAMDPGCEPQSGPGGGPAPEGAGKARGVARPGRTHDRSRAFRKDAARRLSTANGPAGPAGHRMRMRTTPNRSGASTSRTRAGPWVTSTSKTRASGSPRKTVISPEWPDSVRTAA